MHLRLFPLGVALLFLCGCPGELQDPERFLTGGGDAGPGCDVENGILKTKCGTAGCHDATTIAQGLDLATAGVGTRLRTSMATCTSVAGQKMGTFMQNKVTAATPTCGGPMPLGGTMLSAAESQCLSAYLQDAGAL